MKKTSYLDFIHELLADEEQFSAFKMSYQQRIAKSIKILTSRMKKSDFLSFCEQEGRTLTPPQFSTHWKSYDDVLFVEKRGKESLGSHFLHQAGFFYVQEMAAGLSAQVLSPEKGDLVLDLCAAPWGKTIQLADQLLELWSGFVLANEPSNPRRKALIFNLNRCGMLNTAVSAYDGTQIWDLVPESFDKVLVDAPCSGEGMQYKHDKTVHFRDQKSAEKLAKLQTELLLSGLKALKVWWNLVYSTCTLNPLENEGVLSSILKNHGEKVVLEPVLIDQKSAGFQSFRTQELLSASDAEKVARFWPHLQQTGGFFIAKLRKIAPFPPESLRQDSRTLQKSGFNESDALQNQVWNFLSERWDIAPQAAFSFFASQQAVYCTTPEKTKLPSWIFKEKIWIPILKIGFKGERIPQQGLATVLGSFTQKNSIELTKEQAQALSDGKTLSGAYGAEGGFLIGKWQGKGCFLMKQGKWILKGKS